MERTRRIAPLRNRTTSLGEMTLDGAHCDGGVCVALLSGLGDAVEAVRYDAFNTTLADSEANDGGA